MESRIEQAIARHHMGYNCAQAIVCTYADLFGVDEQTAYKMSEAFGFGMGMMEVCGALTGGLMLAGLQNSAGVETPGSTKAATYKIDRMLGEAFSEATGSLLCSELKGRDTGKPLCSCDDCIRHAARIIEEKLLADAQ